MPTAWLSDVLFGQVWEHWGYQGIRWLRILIALGVAFALFRVAGKLTHRLPVRLVGVAIVMYVLQPFLAERPQAISYIFVAALSWQASRILRGQFPRLWLWLALGWLWANVHGMWALAPVVLLVAGVAAWADDRARVPLAARCTLTALCIALAAAVTPVGPRLAIWPLVVQHTAAPISEWQPVTPLERLGLPLTAILVVIFISWRAGGGQSYGRCAFVLAIGAFGYSATRNTAPAAILLLPELLAALVVLWPGPASASRDRPSDTRWTLTTLAAGSVVAVAHLVVTPTLPSGVPLRIVEYLRSSPKEERVLNAYNIGGLLTGLAAPKARVAIDGRTDMWSASYVINYLDSTSGRGDWRKLVDELKPTAAVFPDDNQVARGLVIERGWHVVMTDQHWQLLTR